jgi:cellulose synthase operon protein C
MIRKTSLVRRQKSGVVHCEIELCEAPGTPGRYLVNARQGRTGEEWRESTRTALPVDLATAETLFAAVLAERAAQGFADPAQSAPAAALASKVLTPPALKESPADHALLARLDTATWKKLDERQRTRTIWRIGERRLRAAVPLLVDLIARGKPMQDYCIAWAIGRCGDPGAAIAMSELHKRGSTDAVKRIAQQAWLMLADAQALRQHAEAVIADCPASLRDAWSRRQYVTDQGGNQWTPLGSADWLGHLEQLDQAALADATARDVLLSQLAQAPLRAGCFRAVRHIYKAAEMRADSELFGLIHHRFETTPHSATGYGVYVDRAYRSHREEASRPDSTVAYSKATRDYLRRRSWRTLRRLAEDADPAYIDMALGCLRAMTDDSAGKIYHADGRFYDRYSHWLLFNHMLRAKGGWTATRSGKSWYQRQPIAASTARQEAYPELWDARPDALLWLMHHSRCEGVHEFAGRALIDNRAYCAALALDEIRILLRSPYIATARFAFQVARQRFEPGVPGVEWLLLLLNSSLPEAMQYALDVIARDPVRYCADALLVAAVLTSSIDKVRRQGWLLCQGALPLPGQGAAILERLLDWLDNCGDLDDAENVVPPIAADLLWVIENPLREAAAQAPHERLLALLGHRLASVRILACQWLLLHAAPASAIPGTQLSALLQDKDGAVRAMGVRLFGALPDQLLAGQSDLVAAFCTSPDAGMRRAIDPVLQRVAPIDQAFRSALLPPLMDCLFRSETGEGVHADILAWLAGPLSGAAELEDRALVLRLLSARGKGAQLAGALLLPRFTVEQFSVADWASFARNPNASVRRWAFDAYERHPDQIRANLEEALRLFDSRFDDSKEFGSAFFQAQIPAGAWTPLLLVNLCDHLDPAVQRFGRTMITTHFDVADVTEFMVKLSQHPSANMQLFVSSWLESASAGDLAKLQRLEPYFLSVLSQVNRGRVVKSRVQAFLRQQATLSEDIAAFVARVFARQVVTVAIADKAQYIEGLRTIQEHFPNLTDIMTIHAPRPHTAVRGAQ